MPGRASHTAGMASTAGIAVMIMPSTMKSLNVVAWKSAGGKTSSLVRTDGREVKNIFAFPPPHVECPAGKDCAKDCAGTVSPP